MAFRIGQAIGALMPWAIMGFLVLLWSGNI